MKFIQKDFLLHDLYPILNENNFDGCIAVQANQTEDKNDFLIDLANKNNFIKGIVGWIDLMDDNLKSRLQLSLLIRIPI